MTNTVARQWIIGFFCAGLFMVTGPRQAQACGTLQDQIDWYWQAGDEKPQALRQITDMCDEFSANHSEGPLLAVFSDAIAENIDRAQIRTSFEAYWCLAGGDGYDAIRAALPDADCPAPDDVANWYVVTVDAANIRAGADLGAERLESALRNTLLWKIGVAGEWFKIRRMGRDYEAYVHASLLAPYRPVAADDDTE